MRPKTLAEVAELTMQGESFDLSLREFLDEYYSRPNQSALEAEPALLREKVPERGEVYDAYLAATAEALAGRDNFSTPSWAYRPVRQLRHPWFALTMAPLRAVLLWESPPAFRSRNLFVSENALSRA